MRCPSVSVLEVHATLKLFLFPLPVPFQATIDLWPELWPLDRDPVEDPKDLRRVPKPKAALTVVMDGREETEEKILEGGRLTLLNGTEVRLPKPHPWRPHDSNPSQSGSIPWVG